MHRFVHHRWSQSSGGPQGVTPSVAESRTVVTDRSRPRSAFSPTALPMPPKPLDDAVVRDGLADRAGRLSPREVFCQGNQERYSAMKNNLP